MNEHETINHHGQKTNICVCEVPEGATPFLPPASQNAMRDLFTMGARGKMKNPFPHLCVSGTSTVRRSTITVNGPTAATLCVNGM
jgi:hypothetical protein